MDLTDLVPTLEEFLRKLQQVKEFQRNAESHVSFDQYTGIAPQHYAQFVASRNSILKLERELFEWKNQVREQITRLDAQIESAPQFMAGLDSIKNNKPMN